MLKAFKVTWVVLALVGAFTVGYYFKPGTANSRRIAPRLSPQQMQQMQRMPQRMPVPQRMPQRAPSYPQNGYRQAPGAPAGR